MPRLLSGLQFGTDTSLLRQAADVMRTGSGDDFQVGSSQGVHLTSGGRAGIATVLNTDIMLRINGAGAPNPFNTTNAVIGTAATPSNLAVGNVSGVTAQAISVTTGGTVGFLRGVDASIRFANATGTLTNGYSLYAGPPTISAGGIVTTQHGLYIVAQKVTGVTTAYGI